MLKTLRVSLSNFGGRLQDRYAQRDEGQREKPLGSLVVNELPAPPAPTFFDGGSVGAAAAYPIQGTLPHSGHFTPFGALYPFGHTGRVTGGVAPYGSLIPYCEKINYNYVCESDETIRATALASWR